MLIEKSRGNIDGVMSLMQSLPLHKVRSVLDYWIELTLPEEERYKRMRKESDKAAQEVFDEFISGKVKKEDVKIKPNKDKNIRSDPSTIDRFLDLGLNPDMLNRSNKDTHG